MEVSPLQIQITPVNCYDGRCVFEGDSGGGGGDAKATAAAEHGGRTTHEARE